MILALGPSGGFVQSTDLPNTPSAGAWGAQDTGASIATRTGNRTSLALGPSQSWKLLMSALIFATPSRQREDSRDSHLVLPIAITLSPQIRSQGRDFARC